MLHRATDSPATVPAGQAPGGPRSDVMTWALIGTSRLESADFRHPSPPSVMADSGTAWAQSQRVVLERSLKAWSKLSYYPLVALLNDSLFGPAPAAAGLRLLLRRSPRTSKRTARCPRVRAGGRRRGRLRSAPAAAIRRCMDAGLAPRGDAATVSLDLRTAVHGAVSPHVNQPELPCPRWRNRWAGSWRNEPVTHARRQSDLTSTPEAFPDPTACPARRADALGGTGCRSGFHREVLDVVEHGVEGHFERPDPPLQLGEQQASLECGQGCQGEILGVAVEFAARVHGL